MASLMTAVSEIEPMTADLWQPYNLSEWLGSMTRSIPSVTKTQLWHYTVGDVAFLGFLLVFLYRYVRLIVHVAVYYVFYKPAVPSASPCFTGRDVTVIIPTVSPQNVNFLACLRTCAANSPRRVIVVTVGELLEQKVQDVAARALDTGDHDFEFLIHKIDHPSKRMQMGKGIRKVETAITVLVDDSVIWHPNFLTSLLAPFEDPSVGFVGVSKKGTRDLHAGWVASFWNIMGALYLERANFDYLAPNAIDGGVPVVSGRSSAIRTPIIQNDEFLSMFEDERFFLDLLPAEGEPGLNPDDDNALTRHVVQHGWKIKHQDSGGASRITTSLGMDPNKFRGQVLRWARTTFRSNPRSLFDRHVWRTQPWSVYAVQTAWLINFALFFDPFLLAALGRTRLAMESSNPLWLYLVLWIMATKIVKLLPYFKENPRDLWVVPFYWMFGYWHSLLKLWAMLTFWECTWSGRTLPVAKPAT